MMDKNTEKRIASLHPSIRTEVTQIVNECNAELKGRAKVMITQGLRTFAEQDALYAKGRTKPGAKVTNARGGQSVHNYGFAVDICLLIDGKTAVWDVKTDFDNDHKADWMECVAVFKKHGWDWGGDFKSIVDMPHFQKKGYGDWRKLLAMKRDKDGYILLPK